MNLFEETNSSKKLIVSKKADKKGNWHYKLVELTVFADNNLSIVADTKTLLNFKLDCRPGTNSSIHCNIEDKVVVVRNPNDSEHFYRVYSEQAGE